MMILIILIKKKKWNKKHQSDKQNMFWKHKASIYVINLYFKAHLRRHRTHARTATIFL